MEMAKERLKERTAHPLNSKHQNRAQPSPDPRPNLKPRQSAVSRAISGHVPELGVPVTQIRLLILCQAIQPVVPLASRPQPVLPHAVENAKHRKGERSNLPAEVNRVAGGVSGRVALRVGPPVGEK